MKAASVMVLGCTSDAGKSWLATALCRWYARRGLKVMPFKAQNMSNHARVVPRVLATGAGGECGWGEIGSAQYFQALAARAAPDVRMNPVLLKPEADTRSQVVVMGQVRADLGAMAWRERSALLRVEANRALAELRRECDLLVIEGAGSPAEINLAANDYVNTGTAIASEAACLLVADIDRGGAFAHLYGTHALMDERVRSQVRGFVLNKFRGDANLLAPAPQQLEALTGVPTLAVIPMRRDHGLPEEDAVPGQAGAAAGPRIVVLATPHSSNLDEFAPLSAAGLSVRFARDAAAIAAADWLILPGSKHTRADLQWLRAEGLDAAIQSHAKSGKPLLAICGGMQMLGQDIADPAGLEGGSPGRSAGLGLLPLATEFERHKDLRRSNYRFEPIEGLWSDLSGLAFDGYEIHCGRTTPLAPLACALAGAPGWCRGNVLALYPHGLFENPAVVQALFGRSGRSLEASFDRLADLIDECFGSASLMGLLAHQHGG
ncbi:MAG: cobyric acid synthase [Burkholderiaceae bacterium]